MQRLTVENRKRVKPDSFDIDEKARVLQALRLSREIVADLLSDDLYYKLKHLSERDLELSELVLVKTVEMVKPIKNELKNAKLEINELKSEVRFRNDKVLLMQKELENAERLLKEKDTCQLNYEKNNDKQLVLLREQLKDRDKDIDELNQRLKGDLALRKENKKLKDEIEFLEYKLKLYKPESVENQVHNIERRIEKNAKVLETEKEFLVKDNLNLKEENRRLNEKIHLMEEDTKRQRDKQDKFVNEVLLNQRELTQNYEQKVQQSLVSMKNAHNQELINVRREVKEVYERQISFLTDNGDDLKRDNDHLKTQLSQKTSDLEEAYKESKDLLMKFETDLGQLRVNERIHEEELERKTMEIESLRITEQNLKTENKFLYDQINTLKDQIYTERLEYQNELAQLKSDKISLERQVSAYDQVEKAIDDNIIEMSKNDNETANNITNHLKDMPTAKNRRILQAVELGKKVIEKENECTRLTKLLTEKETELANLNIEFESLKSLFEKTKQPGSYLVRNLEEKEKEIVHYRKEINNLKRDNRELMDKLDIIQGRYETKVKQFNTNQVKKEEILELKRQFVEVIEKDSGGDMQEKFVKMNSVLGDVDERPVKEFDKTVNNLKRPSWVAKLHAKFNNKK